MSAHKTDTGAHASAERPAQLRLAEATSRNTHNVIARLLYESTDDGRVLDIPCGEGAFTQRLLGKGYEVHSADVQCDLKAEGATFRAANMNEALPWEDGFFDVVACIDGIEHIERPFDFVDECRRVLRPGGILLVSTPNISSLRSRWRYLFTGFHNKGKVPLNEAKPSPWHHIGLISFDRLRYMLHRAGFRITAVETNRVKAASWLYLPLVPLARLITSRVFHKEEKDAEQRTRNQEIRDQLFSKAVLFGETLIVRAERVAES